MEPQAAMELQEAMENLEVTESTADDVDDAPEHFEASLSTEQYWTCIDNVSKPADGSVRILPRSKVFKYVGDEFLFLEQIGEGRQGKIFKANLRKKSSPDSNEYTSMRGDYAVKIFKGKLLKNHFGQWPDELFDFHVDCQYICKFYGYFIHQDSFCLVMEKYDCSLRNCIDKHMKRRTYWGRPFHGPVAMGIIIQLAIGMAYLHALNVLHRDLKADNVFVINISEEDDTPAGVLIGDFDISPTVVGTAFWRAPEILQGLKGMDHIRNLYNSGRIGTPVYENMRQTLPYTTKSDVYSFAMTCYEILTGRIPFKGVRLTNYDVVLSGERPKLPSDLNPDMKELLHKCWHHDPDARPSFSVIVSELKRFVEGTEAYMPMFNNSTMESRRVSNSSLESNLLELQELVQVVRTKYKWAEFVGCAVQFLEAVEEFDVQFGLRSFSEHPVLPSVKGFWRLRLLDTIHFKWKMFFLNLPFHIPECASFCRLMQAMVFKKMQEGMAPVSISVPDKPDPEELATWTSIWNAWEEEKRYRLDTSTLPNLHDVCDEILRNKDGNGGNRDRACDVCRDSAWYAPKSKVCTFQLYSQGSTHP